MCLSSYCIMMKLLENYLVINSIEGLREIKENSNSCFFVDYRRSGVMSAKTKLVIVQKIEVR